MTSMGRKLSSVGTALGATGLVSMQVLMQRAYASQPAEMTDLLARNGLAQKSIRASLLIVAYRYAVLRRPILEASGTSLERDRNKLLGWFAVMLTGVVVGVTGLIIEVLEFIVI